MLFKTSSSEFDIMMRPCIAFFTFVILSFMVDKRLLKRMSSWISTMFIDSSYETGYCIYILYYNQSIIFKTFYNLIVLLEFFSHQTHLEVYLGYLLPTLRLYPGWSFYHFLPSSLINNKQYNDRFKLNKNSMQNRQKATKNKSIIMQYIKNILFIEHLI